ncbi:hypothetical protein LFL97_00155 [Burkholderia sp. JSH-S8]|nr:hypothetical protein LFL97_00155 [Burkholderia sp. JSH-S8]
MNGSLTRPPGKQFLPRVHKMGAQFSKGMLALLMVTCVVPRTQAATSYPRTIVGPYYPWMQFDEHRSMQLAPIYTPGGRISERAEWRFVDDARHTSTFFDEESELRYVTFRTDDPDTIVFFGKTYTSRRCNGDYYSNIPCPSIDVFLSQDGGRHFTKRVVILPPLAYSVGGGSYGGGAIGAGGTLAQPMPFAVVRRGVLYLALGGRDAKPRILDEKRPGDVGVSVKYGERIGFPYSWPKESVPLWDWRGWSPEPPLEPKPIYLYTVELPKPQASPAEEVTASDPPTRAEQVCSWRRMNEQSSRLPPLQAVSLIGSRLEAFGALPAFEAPQKPPYSTRALVSAANSEKDRAALLRDMQAEYPEWVASQLPVARLFPEMSAPRGNTAKVNDRDIKCEP